MALGASGVLVLLLLPLAPLHLLEVIPYVLLVRSFPYQSDLCNLDIVYAAFYPAFIHRVLFKRITLGEYFY